MKIVGSNTFLISGLLLMLALIPFVFDEAFAFDYKKHVTSEDLGILQLAAHDLFNVDRCDGKPECLKEQEDGKLNLSTLFFDTTDPLKTEFPLETVALGGEHRNRENIMLFTVASTLGEKYKKLVDSGMDSDNAKNVIITEYHSKLAESYKKTFGEPFPPLDDSDNSLDDLYQQNLALRTVHDFLPGKIKVDNRWISTLDPSLHGKTLDSKELEQKSSKLDGKFDEEFLNIEICLDPPGCNFMIMVNLLEADKSFGAQTGTPDSFDDFLEELKDGLYDEDDSVTIHIRELMAKGQNF